MCRGKVFSVLPAYFDIDKKSYPFHYKQHPKKNVAPFYRFQLHFY